MPERADGERRSPIAGRALLALFVLSNLGYFALDPETRRFVPWLALYSFQFMLVLGILRLGPVRLREIVAAALASRVLLWFTEPVMEADFYRYLWDGHVLSHGINPFLYAPSDSALDAVETGYRFFITHSEFSTIYPPVAQLVFWLAHSIAADSLLALKVVLTGFDVATGVVLTHWLMKRRDGHWAALYWLNPLVLKEVANSAHLDSVPVFFATAALYLMSTRAKSAGWAWALLALSTGSKWYACSLAPLFARCDPRWRRHLALFAAIVALVYLPFIGAGASLFGGTAAFGRYWLFNASLFRLVSLGWSAASEAGPLLARVTVGVAFVGLVGWRARRLETRDELPDASRFVLAALLLLSPVVDAWYVLWILPVAVLTRSTPWIVFTWVVSFSYAWFYSQEMVPYFQFIEYAVLLMALGLHRPRRPSIVA